MNRATFYFYIYLHNVSERKGTELYTVKNIKPHSNANVLCTIGKESRAMYNTMYNFDSVLAYKVGNRRL
ncbi:MAG: hypothetical protein CL666_13705 [Balneola sp.]|nr:hypothetical protein [Balneola sp.]